MSLTEARLLQTANPPARALSRGLGLAIGAVISLAMWVGLIRLALAVLGG